jgi:hypothetical protein
VPLEVRQLIRDMSLANPLWGAPRIHGELLKLGIDVGQTSVAKYMARRRGPPSQGWKTFLRNHADGIAAMDLFMVPTLSFRLLYGLLTCGMTGAGSYGWQPPRTRPLNGSPEGFLQADACLAAMAAALSSRLTCSPRAPSTPSARWRRSHQAKSGSWLAA